jgi:hypothetical protein
MTTKLLNFYDFARAATPWAVRAKAISSANPLTTLTRAADSGGALRLRTSLECRWYIDPATGALLARWELPAADAALEKAAGTQNPDAYPGRRLRLPHSKAAVSAASRAAA